jgi:Terminase RNaseH-like domain
LYYIGVDGATVGNDYTVAIVLEYDLALDWYSVIDIYRKRKTSIEGDIYHIGELIDKYSPDTVAVESNGVGAIFLEQLAANHRSIKTIGVHTSQDSKLAMIERLSLALEKGVLMLPKTSPIVNEMLSFRRVGKKLEASPGNHDDTVMALAVCLSATDFRPRKKPLINISYEQSKSNNLG